MKKKSTMKVMIMNSARLVKKQNIRMLLTSFLVSFLFGSYAIAANFEVDSSNILPNYGFSSDFILYAKLMPARGGQDDTCINAGFALSENPMTTWGDYSCYVRFDDIDTWGYVDVRNGSAMMALDSVPFELDMVYHVWIDVHFYEETYDVYVQAPGETEPVLIAANAAFRRTGISGLGYFSAIRNGDFIQTTAHVEVLEMMETDTIGLAPEGPNKVLIPSAPDLFSLENHPNPFTYNTTISYNLPEKANVKLVVFNALGQEILTMVNQVQQPGIYKFEFTNDNRKKGLYYYRLQAGNNFTTRKMILE